MRGRAGLAEQVSCNATKCDRLRCSHCSAIHESDCFTSTTTSYVHKIKQNLPCASTDVIYLNTCRKCKAQYVGQTHQKCENRMNDNKFVKMCSFLNCLPIFQNISVLPNIAFKTFHLCILRKFQIISKDF